MKKTKVFDESKQLFTKTKKGKEQEHFMARNPNPRVVESNGYFYSG